MAEKAGHYLLPDAAALSVSAGEGGGNRRRVHKGYVGAPIIFLIGFVGRMA